MFLSCSVIKVYYRSDLKFVDLTTFCKTDSTYRFRLVLQIAEIKPYRYEDKVKNNHYATWRHEEIGTKYRCSRVNLQECDPRNQRYGLCEDNPQESLGAWRCNVKRLSHCIGIIIVNEGFRIVQRIERKFPKL